MQQSTKSHLIVFFFTLLMNFSFGQTNKTEKIDSIMQKAYEKGYFNGNVLITKNNKTLYNTSFGFTDETNTKPLKIKDRFHLGSITKEFSAVAIMQLLEKNKLKLDDKVTQYIPELPSWAKQITINQLLNYTNGLPNVNWKQVKNDQDIFDGFLQIDSLDFTPGSNYAYNMNTIFLRQFIVERITGVKYKTYVEKNIFQVCDMNSTVMTPILNEPDLAKGFNNDLIADKLELPITGGTYTTTADLLKWIACLHSKKLINKNSLYVLGQHYNLPETQSGIGEATYKNKKLRTHLHDGRAGSYEALFVTDENKKIAIIFLGNSYKGKLFDLADSIQLILK